MKINGKLFKFYNQKNKWQIGSHLLLNINKKDITDNIDILLCGI